MLGYVPAARIAVFAGLINNPVVSPTHWKASLKSSTSDTLYFVGNHQTILTDEKMHQSGKFLVSGNTRTVAFSTAVTAEWLGARGKVKAEKSPCSLHFIAGEMGFNMP